MAVFGVLARVAYTCGLGVFGDFSKVQGDAWQGRSSLSQQNYRPNGTGYAVAGFIDTEACKEAYEVLTSRYKVEYQSEVRLNTNSGNNFFFVIFDTRE